MEEKREADSPSVQGKLYYSIGEVAEVIGENPSLLRFWEKQFPGISPARNRKGNRIYTQAQLRRIVTIHYLVKSKGYTLSGASDALRTAGDDLEKQAELRQRLSVLREWLLQLRDTL